MQRAPLVPKRQRREVVILYSYLDGKVFVSEEGDVLPMAASFGQVACIKFNELVALTM